MFVVDTNILIYAANEDFTEHRQCKHLIEDWCRQSGIWYITWGIVYEFIRVVTHPRIFQNPWSCAEAWRFIEYLLSAPTLHVLAETDLHSAVVKEFISQYPHIMGNTIFDAHIAILMREHGIQTIYTRDTHFYAFSGITVIDPLLKQTGSPVS
jgi:hypothetical protein